MPSRRFLDSGLDFGMWFVGERVARHDRVEHGCARAHGEWSVVLKMTRA